MTDQRVERRERGGWWWGVGGHDKKRKGKGKEVFSACCFLLPFLPLRPGGSSDIHFVHYSHHYDQKGVTVKNVLVQSGSKNEMGGIRGG